MRYFKVRKQEFDERFVLFQNYFMGGNCLSTTRNDMNAPVVIPATSKHTATVSNLYYRMS